MTKSTQTTVFLALAIVTGLWMYVFFRNGHVSVRPHSASDDSGIVFNQLLHNVSGASRGPADAGIQLVEFTDLQCPSCKQFQPTMERLLKENPDVRFVVQSFPLPMHPWAFKAASYAECVSGNGDLFWKFMAAVYDQQSSITLLNADQELTGIAGALGMDVPSIAACATRAETAAKVNKSIDLGKQVGVTGTPTLFINGRKLTAPGDFSYDQLNTMVRSAPRVHAGLRENPVAVSGRLFRK
jgi:protein-disulfide isomerase